MACIRQTASFHHHRDVMTRADFHHLPVIMGIGVARRPAGESQHVFQTAKSGRVD
jgi:hypothetical protein